MDYTEPERPGKVHNFNRCLSHGTFALQGHDPGSEVRFRKIKVRPVSQ